jgi:hypothetical protein
VSKIYAGNFGGILSKTNNAMRAVSNLVTFIKERTAQNLMEASQRGIITADKDALQRIISVAQDAIEQAYTVGSSNVEKSLK